MAASVVLKRVSMVNVLSQFKNSLFLSDFINNSKQSWMINMARFSLLHRTSSEVFSKEKTTSIQHARGCRSHTLDELPPKRELQQDPVIPGAGDNFSFGAVKYPITKQEFTVLSNPGSKVLHNIMSKSHALIRIPREGSNNSIILMIGGSQDQIRMAKDLLQQSLPKLVKEQFSSDQTSAKGGEKLLWHGYVRNFKGQIPPQKTRKKCIRGQYVGTGNPCPVCKFLIDDPRYDKLSKVDYQDVELLKNFISPQSGKVIDYKITGVCQRRQKELIAATEKAKDYGLIPYSIPGPRDIPKPFKFAGVPYKVRHKR